MEGLGTSDGYSPSLGGKSEMVGYYGSGMKTIPRRRRSMMTYRIRRHAKPIGMFLVLAAVALVAAAIAPALFAQVSGSHIPAKINDGPPPPPYTVFGYLTDNLGNPALLVLVTITDNNTGAVWTNVTDDVFGFYTVDLNTQPLNWNASDTIYVYATDGTYEGSNEGIALGPGNEAYLWLNIAMNSPVGIPEFPMVIMPVIGMVAIAAVVSLKRRRGEM
jgi:hypothetical protein